MHRQLMDIMGQHQGASPTGKPVGEDILRPLMCLGRRKSPVVGVEVCGDDVVGESAEAGQACSVAREVWRARVGRGDAEDVAQRILVGVYLVVELLRGDGVEVGVRPGVLGDLVAGCFGALGLVAC